VSIGDVSGKGMPAAMTVSLLVGTLRTLAHYYTEALARFSPPLNQRMLGARTTAGIHYLPVLTVSSAGILTAANARHNSALISTARTCPKTASPSESPLASGT